MFLGVNFFLNPNGNLTDGIKTRLKKNLKYSNNPFFSYETKMIPTKYLKDQKSI